MFGLVAVSNWSSTHKYATDCVFSFENCLTHCDRALLEHFDTCGGALMLRTFSVRKNKFIIMEESDISCIMRVVLTTLIQQNNTFLYAIDFRSLLFTKPQENSFPLCCSLAKVLPLSLPDMTQCFLNLVTKYYLKTA
jgi:hypothetical protein